MRSVADLGPKEWSEEFYSEVIRREDDNNHPQVAQADVDGWRANIAEVTRSVTGQLRAIIEVAK